MADNNLEKFKSKNPLQQLFIKRFFSVVTSMFGGAQPVSTVLDVGCGEGFTLRSLSEKYPNCVYTGIDPDPEALTYAKNKSSKAIFLQGSIYALPFPDNSFDCVICNEVLEHLERPQDGIKELLRVTKKDCIISVPHEPLFRISNFLRGRNIMRFGNYPYHVNTWSKRQIRSLVERYFSVVEIKTPFPWTVLHGRKRTL